MSKKKSNAFYTVLIFYPASIILLHFSWCDKNSNQSASIQKIDYEKKCLLQWPLLLVALLFDRGHSIITWIVDIILPLFDYLPTSTWTFLTLTVDFGTTYLPTFTRSSHWTFPNPFWHKWTIHFFDNSNSILVGDV